VDEILSSTKSLHNRRSCGRPRRTLSQWQSHETSKGSVPPSSTRSRIIREARQSESNSVGRLDPPPKQNAANSSSLYAGVEKAQNFEMKVKMQREPMKQKRILYDDSIDCYDIDYLPDMHMKGKEERPLTPHVREPLVSATQTTAQQMEEHLEASNSLFTNHEAINPEDETNHTKKAVLQKSLEFLISQIVAKYNQYTGKTFSQRTSSSADKFDENASPESILKFIPSIFRIILSTKSDPTFRNFNKSNAQSDLEAKKNIESKSEVAAAVHVSESEMVDPESNFSSTLKSVLSVKYIVHNRPNASEVATIVDPNEETGGDDTRRKTSTTMTNEEQIVREIQWQIWTRMIVWDAAGKEGLAYLDRLLVLKAEDDLDGEIEAVNVVKGNHSKKKEKGKKRKKSESNQPVVLSPKQNLVKEVIALMELAPYVLPPSVEFSQWVKEVLSFGFRKSLPDYGGDILGHFEIELADQVISLNNRDTDATEEKSASKPPQSPTTTINHEDCISPTRKVTEERHKLQRAYFSSLMERVASDMESASLPSDATALRSLSTATSSTRSKASFDIHNKEDAKLFKTSLPLTAPHPKSNNPYLKGASRGTYVGSHLSSKLSNISTLFREVQAPSKKKLQQQKQQQQLQQQQPLDQSVNTKVLPKTIDAKTKQYAKSPSESTKLIHDYSVTPTFDPAIYQSPPRKRPRPTSFSSPNTRRNMNLRDQHHHTPTRHSVEGDVAYTPRQIIEETPQKPRLSRNTSRLSRGSYVAPPNFASALSTSRTTDLSPAGASDETSPLQLSPMPQERGMMSSVVAEAAKAARRKRR